LNAVAFEKANLENRLRNAVANGELELFYQPKVEIATERIVGFEGLLRWRHPELGLVSPTQFIPLAEETGMILPIGRWVLERACRDAKSWQDAGLPPVKVAVNLSSAQFREPQLFDSVMGALRAAGLGAEWLELELTESMLMHDVESAAAILRRLKAEGISIAIDDFGTGYSSLSYLKRFPIDALKIDRSFIREINTDPDDAAISTSIILMGRSLKLRVVAEGVETRSQLAFLRVMQCDEAQGYLFSQPVQEPKARALLEAQVPVGLRRGIEAA
jgi:EAL domain-containing protein (putative c-di-GMP-specific phosphodiesterase class I)